MLDTMITELPDVRLWIVVLIVTIFGVIDKVDHFYEAGKRGGNCCAE